MPIHAHDPAAIARWAREDPPATAMFNCVKFASGAQNPCGGTFALLWEHAEKQFQNRTILKPLGEFSFVSFVPSWLNESCTDRVHVVGQRLPVKLVADGPKNGPGKEIAEIRCAGRTFSVLETYGPE